MPLAACIALMLCSSSMPRGGASCGSNSSDSRSSKFAEPRPRELDVLRTPSSCCCCGWLTAGIVPGWPPADMVRASVSYRMSSATMTGMRNTHDHC